ncbi:uncharacterized protein [Kogia breviceps]|uniref:uncharacterized protein isoform X2 n=1 Tax=Kogia breviceps TaxID=27615 RepID=UPI0034D1C6EA
MEVKTQGTTQQKVLFWLSLHKRMTVFTERSLPPCPVRCLLHTVGCHSRTLLQTESPWKGLWHLQLSWVVSSHLIHNLMLTDARKIMQTIIGDSENTNRLKFLV